MVSVGEHGNYPPWAQAGLSARTILRIH